MALGADNQPLFRCQPMKRQRLAHPSGIFVVDKPAGMSSAKLVAVVKKAIGVQKVGHAGTLDPFATGVMLCLINKATKLSQFLLNSAKAYEAVLHLGVETDTQDPTGQVIASCEVPSISEQRLEAVLTRFRGQINQVPPSFSALKHQGIPLYRLARKGQMIQKPARPVRIFELETMNVRFPEVRLNVVCSAGTYIRTLCADIGKALGCGGHLKHLVRTEGGGFRLSEAMSLDALVEQASVGNVFDKMIPLSSALRDMPAVVADEELTEKIRFGRAVSQKKIWGNTVLPSKKRIKIIDTNRRLLAVLTLEEGEVLAKYECVFIT